VLLRNRLYLQTEAGLVGSLQERLLGYIRTLLEYQSEDNNRELSVLFLGIGIAILNEVRSQCFSTCASAFPHCI